MGKSKITIIFVTAILIIMLFIVKFKFDTITKSNNKLKSIQNVEIKYKNNEKEIQENDNNVVTYIDETEKNIDIILEKDIINKKDENILKESFIKITDFIFYDGKINDITFNELKEETKVKIINIYERIDEKIESKVPGYKDTIKETGKKTYHNIKELTEQIKETYKEKIGEDKYKKLVETYEEEKENLKYRLENYKPYIEEGKEKAKSKYEKVKEKISNWYQGYKEG